MSERVMEIEPALVLRDAQGMAASGNRSRVLEGPFVADFTPRRMSAYRAARGQPWPTGTPSFAH